MKKRRGKYYLSPMLSFAASKAAVYVGAGIVPILLFDNSEKLGFWWFLLLAGYISLLIWARAALLWRRERVRLLRDLGEEQFYAAFPRERKLAQRRAKRAARKLARKAKRQGTQAAPPPWEPRR